MGSATAAQHRGPGGGFFNVDAESSARVGAVICLKLPNGATYVWSTAVAEGTIDPPTCTAEGTADANRGNRGADQTFTFYAYDVATPHWPAGQQ